MKKIRGTPKKKKIKSVRPPTISFPIVGIGASAGGLEAYQELLKNLSAKPGMAIVFIMHLAPEHKSMLTELLGRSTKMPVREIKNGMPIEVNHVYVIPPSSNLSIAGGKLKLNKMKDAGLKRMPIDWFFHSLAEEQGNRAIGVILSGTATDGTLGAEAIKAEGGIVFAQDEKTAKYDGMPQSAIAAGCVDFVLSPKKIAGELERIARHPLISSAGPVKTDKSIITKVKGLEGILDILRLAKGLDFTGYKTATIHRRISRRMVLLKLENLKGYIKFLRENKAEVENLYEDMLLKVTSFFRDPKVFDVLKKQVLPAILKNKTKGQEVRIWIPGCSSGNEAYSIAICLLEELGNKRSSVPIRIFATDVNESSIDKARQGIYGKNIENDFTPERLKRFFIKTSNSYKVSKQLREMCIFSKQNVFSDPPFSNLDLISCRNLLIYLQPVLQKKVFYNFHYGLRPGGFLLLGNSESAGGYSNLFKTLDRKQRIFVKKYLSVSPELESGQKYYPLKKLEIKEKAAIRKGKETDIESMVERIVLDEYAPCGVLIDSNMEVVQFRGHTGRFLESAAGKPSLDIFKLAREELLMPLRAAIFKARGTKHTVKREAGDFRYNGRRMRVNITVVPVKSGPLKEEFLLVLFDELTAAAGLKNLPKSRGKISLKGKSVKSDEYINNLRKELAETKEYLQTVIEEQESANEEVKTANEEILSSNEELLSTNEELETAKEELQSSNEELITTNEELQSRNKEVVLLNNDLINLLSSINMPVVMMGTDLVIRRVTPQAEKALNIISSDVGRGISKIKLNVDIPDFEEILSDVIESLHSKTLEIKSREGNWYSVYIRPYRTLDNKIDGVVAIFIDITGRKKAQQVIEEARAYAESILETMREPLIVLDTDLKVISANRAFYQTFKVSHKETEGRFIYDLGNRQWDIPKLRHLLEGILPKNNTFDDYEIEHDFETIGHKTMLLNTRRLAAMQMILITIEDITERKQMEKELAQAKEEEFRSVFDNAVDGILMADMESKKFYMGNNSICRMLGYRLEEIKNLVVKDIHPEKDLAYVMSQFERQSKGDIRLAEDLPVKRKDGSIFYADVSATTIVIAGKAYLIGFFRDTTNRKLAEEALRKSEREKEFVLSNVAEMISYLDCGLRIVWTNKAAGDMAGMPPQEMIGHYCYEIWCNAERPCKDCLVKKAIETGQPQEGEIRSDSKVWFMRGYPVLGDDGSILGAVETVLDITERKRMEESLAKEHNLLRSLVDTLPDYIYVKDINSRFVFGNTSVASHLGVKSPEELSGKTDLDFFPKEMAQRFLKEEHEIIKSGKAMIDSERTSEIDRAHTVTKVPWRDDKGDIIGIIGINHDIMERKRAEEAIQAASLYTRSLIEASPDCLVIISPEGKITDVNKATELITGVSRGHLIGNDFSSYFTEPDKATEGYKKVISKGRAMNYPLTIRHISGHTTDVLCNATIYHNQKGQVAGVFVDARDITEPKKAQEKLLEYQEKLKSLASQLFLTAENERRRLATGVHDHLGQQLALIKLRLQSLMETIHDLEMLGALKQTCSEVDRAIEDSHSLTFELSNPVLYELGLEAAIEQWLTEHIEEKHGIKCSFISDIGTTVLNQEISIVLFQAVRELLINVVKHAKASTVEVIVRKKNEMVEIAVKDNGIGFEQFDKTFNISDSKKGGFGLFSIKERIGYLGGSLNMESDSQNGTRITISVPLKTKAVSSKGGGT